MGRLSPARWVNVLSRCLSLPSRACSISCVSAQGALGPCEWHLIDPLDTLLLACQKYQRAHTTFFWAQISSSAFTFVQRNTLLTPITRRWTKVIRPGDLDNNARLPAAAFHKERGPRGICLSADLRLASNTLGLPTRWHCIVTTASDTRTCPTRTAVSFIS